MEPLSHRGLPRLSWIDTLYSSTCALGPGRPGGNGPRSPDGPRGPDLPGLSGEPRAGLGVVGTAGQAPGGREVGGEIGRRWGPQSGLRAGGGPVARQGQESCVTPFPPVV